MNLDPGFSLCSNCSKPRNDALPGCPHCADRSKFGGATMLSVTMPNATTFAEQQYRIEAAMFDAMAGITRPEQHPLIKAPHKTWGGHESKDRKIYERCLHCKQYCLYPADGCAACGSDELDEYYYVNCEKCGNMNQESMPCDVCRHRLRPRQRARNKKIVAINVHRVMVEKRV